jgi:hypothetical protein
VGEDHGFVFKSQFDYGRGFLYQGYVIGGRSHIIVPVAGGEGSNFIIFWVIFRKY